MQYFAIWKEIFLEKNQVDEVFFDNHVEPQKSSLRDWLQGTSFSLCYTLKVDWAIASQCETFIVEIAADNAYYPYLNLPRNTALNKEEIKLAVENRAFGSFMANVNQDPVLAFASLEEAVDDLTAFAGVSNLCFRQIHLDKFHFGNGNLILRVAAEYEGEENKCIFGTIDLMTGEKEVYDSPCVI